MNYCFIIDLQNIKYQSQNVLICGQIVQIQEKPKSFVQYIVDDNTSNIECYSDYDEENTFSIGDYIKIYGQLNHKDLGQMIKCTIQIFKCQKLNNINEEKIHIIESFVTQEPNHHYNSLQLPTIKQHQQLYDENYLSVQTMNSILKNFLIITNIIEFFSQFLHHMHSVLGSKIKNFEDFLIQKIDHINIINETIGMDKIKSITNISILQKQASLNQVRILDELNTLTRIGFIVQEKLNSSYRLNIKDVFHLLLQILKQISIKSSIKVSKLPSKISKFYQGYSKKIELNLDLILYIIKCFINSSLVFESGFERVTIEYKFKEFNTFIDNNSILQLLQEIQKKY